MKYLIPIVAVCLCSGCATRKVVKSDPPTAVPGSSISQKRMPSVRTPETVKAYPVGRYSDPNFPDAMHERHTVYRREQSPDWNYLPDPPYALPLGPTVANSNPSPSYYVRSDSETMNAQQRAYAEALQEQNRAMKKRIESLQGEAGKIPELQQEIDRLKKQLDAIPDPVDAPSPEPGSSGVSEDEDVFSSVEPPLPAWDESEFLTPSTEEDEQTFLISQMRLNDEFTAALAAVERQRITARLVGPILRRREFASLNNTKP
ncbi:MAG: hypothetical protein IAE94_05020 [Chthoniobacterales bacterium]|nr:hypothetical protein [Chthoniobacterales bacterium]